MEYIPWFIYQMSTKNPNWYFVSHEALSQNPISEFKKIYYLKIRF